MTPWLWAKVAYNGLKALAVLASILSPPHKPPPELPVQHGGLY